MAMLASTVPVLYFQGRIGKGVVFIYFYIIAVNTMLLSRSTSIFTTVLITILNYISIAFPLTSVQWFTARRTKLLVLSSFLLSLCLGIPRYLSVFVGENHLKEEQFNVSRLNEFPNILKPTQFSRFFYGTLNGVHNQIDYWAPLPLLMIFILLSYWNVRKINKRRKDLNFNQKNDIQAVTMFLPVVIALFVCNISPIVYYSFMHFKGIIYREMFAMVCLSAALNSSLNFPIYYFRASNFRNEARSLLSQQSIPTIQVMSSLGE
ncbi:unnamed protein product [Orchesella dallaii]|uniref:G-protein coupled receptors family 1 profile domain-containing protein n=1 Tax=Orchesella dallaii TaxID=48710 RepID=A0ABP1PSG0_9HEXA